MLKIAVTATIGFFAFLTVASAAPSTGVVFKSADQAIENAVLRAPIEPFFVPVATILDNESDLKMSLSTISQSQWYLEVLWLGEGVGKSFRIAFHTDHLKNFDVSQLLVQSPDDHLISLTDSDRLRLALLNEKLQQDAKMFPGKASVIEVLTRTVAQSSNATREPKLPLGSLCTQIGKWAYGSYTAYGETKVVLAPVGDSETACYGKCGAGCATVNKFNSDCLAHDICNRIEGTQLGECKGEFLAAIISTKREATCR